MEQPLMELLQWDWTVFVWINGRWSNAALDTFMPWITHLGDAVAVCGWIALAGLLLIRADLAGAGPAGMGQVSRHALGKTVVSSCLFMALIYGVTAGAYNGLKYLSQRARPYVAHSVILRVSPATAAALHHESSFPSGHAANAFMVAAILASLLRRTRYRYGLFALAALAALVALSRVYLGLHYPIDVLAGAAIGLAVACLMLRWRPLRSPVCSA